MSRKKRSKIELAEEITDLITPVIHAMVDELRKSPELRIQELVVIVKSKVEGAPRFDAFGGICTCPNCTTGFIRALAALLGGKLEVQAISTHSAAVH